MSAILVASALGEDAKICQAAKIPKNSQFCTLQILHRSEHIIGAPF